MKKELFLSLMTICLCGCSSNNSIPATPKGKMDCYSIHVANGSSSGTYYTYSASYSKVYEYKSINGDSLYVNQYIQDSNYYLDTVQNVKIKAYPNRYTQECVEYTFNRFIGFLTLEYNYYLDLEARIIDSEIKWSKYEYDTNPEVITDLSVNNSEAYECAKKSYYLVNTYASEFYTLKLDLTEHGLDRHTYTLVGDDSSITYTEKWF